MMDNEKIAPALRRQLESGQKNTEYINSTCDTTMKSNERQVGIVEALLPQGSENAVKIVDLMQKTGIKSARSLQSIIADEREKGALILSTVKGGYFLPDDGEKGFTETAEFISTLRHRALNTLKILKAANKSLSDLNEQLSFKGW